MPPKHSARPLGPAQTVLSAAAAVLVMLVVWVAVRAIGPAAASRQHPVMLPAPSSAAPTSPAPSSPAPTSPAPSSPAPTSASPTGSPSPSRTSAAPRRTSASPKRTTTTPTPRATTKKKAPPVSNDLAAILNVPANWQQGYVAAVRVRNNGRTAHSFTVTVSSSDARLAGTWNAHGTQSGDTMTFTGGPLQPGASVTFGFQVSKNGQGGARPTGCSVVGGKCTMS